MKNTIALGFCLATAVTLGASQALAASQVELEESARLLATLLDSGRAVLAKAQPLINDKDKADKGFTGAVFESQLIDEFKKRSNGVDLRDLSSSKLPERGKVLLQTLLKTGKDVIDEKQSLINEKGKGYKNVIPATWGTWTGERFTTQTGVLLKQTALDWRNHKNAPDGFESDILKQFAEASYPRQGEKVIARTEGKQVRLLLPLYHKKGCLACHGSPKGAIDVSGYKMEGHVEGDPAGAISVAIPMEE